MDWASARFQTEQLHANSELLEAIKQLDATSSTLIETTNKVTAVGLGVATVGGLATCVGTFLALWQVFHH